MNKIHNLSLKMSKLAGSPLAFGAAILLIIIWLITGPIYNFSNTWLISIATLTDVIIFLMVFSIQNTQYRDAKAIQLKLNELISADQKARDSFIGLESLTDEKLSDLDKEFQKLIKDIESPNILHKIHKTIKQEKTNRPSFYAQAGNLVDHIISREQ